MASTFGSFEIAKSGMMAYNNKLQVVAHNVANIETKGYSKQVTNITSVVGQRNSFAVQGYGVETVSITRTRSEYFDTKFQQTQSKFSKYETEAYYLNSLQDAICGDVTADNKSRILDAFDDFYAALSNLKGKPNDKTVRTQAVEIWRQRCSSFRKKRMWPLRLVWIRSTHMQRGSLLLISRSILLKCMAPRPMI